MEKFQCTTKMGTFWQPTGEADLLSEHSGVQVSDVPRIPAKRALGVQCEGDGNWNIDGTRVLQQKGHLGAGSGLATGHHHALRRGGLIQAVFYRLILWHAEVQLVEAQQEGVPVLQGQIVIWFSLPEQWTVNISADDKVTLRVKTHTDYTVALDSSHKNTNMWLHLTSVNSGDLISFILKK